MKVKQLIAKLQKLNQNDEVVIGGVTEYAEQIKTVEIGLVIDDDASNGQRSVVTIQGFDYGDGETYEFLGDVD